MTSTTQVFEVEESHRSLEYFHEAYCFLTSTWKFSPNHSNSSKYAIVRAVMETKDEGTTNTIGIIEHLSLVSEPYSPAGDFEDVARSLW